MMAMHREQCDGCEAYREATKSAKPAKLLAQAPRQVSIEEPRVGRAGRCMLFDVLFRMAFLGAPERCGLRVQPVPAKAHHLQVLSRC